MIALPPVARDTPSNGLTYAGMNLIKLAKCAAFGFMSFHNKVHSLLYFGRKSWRYPRQSFPADLPRAGPSRSSMRFSNQPRFATADGVRVSVRFLSHTSSAIPVTKCRSPCVWPTLACRTAVRHLSASAIPCSAIFGASHK